MPGGRVTRFTYDSNATSYFNSSYQSGKAPSPDAPRIEDVTTNSVYYCSIEKRVPNTSTEWTTAGSNPTSYPKTAFGIYGIFNKKSGSKNPERLDAVGFAPTASKVLECYVTSKQYRCCQFQAST